MFARTARTARTAGPARRAKAAAVGASAIVALLLTACHTYSGSGTDGAAGAGNGLPTIGSGAVSPSTIDGVIAVVAGENSWGDIAKQIGGSHIAVTSIISDPNADPHEYETSVSDAAAVAGASLVIQNGAGYDTFMTKLMAAAPNKGRAVLTVATLVGVTGSNPNPHLWYDPDYVDTTARAIEAELAARQPAATASFQANLATFLAGEQKAVAVIDQIKAKYDGTAIAYTERVPGYLVTAAGLHLGTPATFSQAIEDGTDPSPLDNAAFEQALADRSVRVLLYNAQVSDAETKHLRSLAQHDGVPVVGVTETLPRGENFQTWQANQAQALLTALGG
jgi:zinc/manganese transport system substrate-binding protein